MKVEYISCNKLVKDGLICPHDLTWTLNYIIKFSVYGVAYHDPINREGDLAVLMPNCCVIQSWSGIYLKTVDGEPFRMGWTSKPDYTKCFCNTCAAAPTGFKPQWKKSKRFLDKINWHFERLRR